MLHYKPRLTLTGRTGQGSLPVRGESQIFRSSSASRDARSRILTEGALRTAISREPLQSTSADPAPPPRLAVNSILEGKAKQAFDALVREDPPAYITHVFTQVARASTEKSITATLVPHLREASEGLVEGFYLTDLLKPNNPIACASEGTASLCAQRLEGG